jgi:hypothetical protein
MGHRFSSGESIRFPQKGKEKHEAHKTVSEVWEIDLVTKPVREMTGIDSGIGAPGRVGVVRVKLKVELSCSTEVKGFIRIKQL